MPYGIIYKPDPDPDPDSQKTGPYFYGPQKKRALHTTDKAMTEMKSGQTFYDNAY